MKEVSISASGNQTKKTKNKKGKKDTTYGTQVRGGGVGGGRGVGEGVGGWERGWGVLGRFVNTGMALDSVTYRAFYIKIMNILLHE